MKKIILATGILYSSFLMAMPSFSVNCEADQVEKNNIVLKAKADFNITQEKQSLSDLVADADIKIHIKGKFNDKEIYNEKFSLKGQYRKVNDDEVAFDEQVTSYSKKINLNYFFINKNKGSMTLIIDNLLENGQQLTCKVVK